MKLGVDARPLNHPHNGIGRYTREILNQILVQTDWQLFLYGYEGEIFSDTDRVVFRPTGSTSHAFSTVWMQAFAPIRCKLDAIDLFFSPRHHLPLFLNIPQVLTVHDLVWKAAPETMKLTGLWLERILMPPSIKRADRVISVSQSTAQQIKQIGPLAAAKTTVIHEAASDFEVSFSDETEEGHMLFVGSLEPRKNLERVLRALSEIKRGGVTSARLTIVSSGEWKTNVRELVKTLEISESVTFIAGADDCALQRCYQKCDFLVFPSLYEGFGLPILEAMRFNKPVITSNISAMPEVAGPGALLVNPLDTADISKAMERLLSDRAWRNRLAVRAGEHAGNFSWVRAGEATIRVIGSVQKETHSSAEH